jgi:hypothetical protein
MDKGTQDTARRVVSTVALNASADAVWQVVGGFYTIHLWHPDIAELAIDPQQARIPQLRRVLTFPGQPTTTEELVAIDHPGRGYRYKWHAGAWGERVKDYQAELRVVELVIDQSCLVQWSSTFRYHEDALSEFYQHGFDALIARFGKPQTRS